MVDVSTSVVGGVLQQITEGHAKPLAFFSKALNSSQVSYSVINRELLAMYSTCHCDILGTFWRVALLPFLPITSRDISHETSYCPAAALAFVCSTTDRDVRYISGENNVVADCLSRPADLNALCNKVQAVDFAAMNRAQQTDDSITTLLKADHS